MLSGVITAIVTPFLNNKVDEESLSGLISFQLEKGIHGIVPCGTTGESPTLSIEEYRRVVEISVDTVNKKVPVVAGAGANSTAKAVELTRCAKSLGVDATLQVVPYYNKPTQEGLFRHFKAVAEVGLPVVLYNVPGRTGIDLHPKTVVRLAKLPEIIAIKEASGSITQMAEIRQHCGDQLTLLTGDDAQTLPAMCMGGEGVVSVLSNLLPQEMVEMYRNWQEGDTAKAIDSNAHIFPMMQAMFMEANPVPVKTAMAMKGIIKSSEVRLPLCSMSDENEKELTRIMQEAGIL
ncbi:MAG: 4-hydroxy-tetrahydrodipicolinate synthase [Desulfobulbaceae bacterium S3730MH12]|nr:MAG: 4-hydroxy-tetrahydrodipicolinate synthase [Desulfobulbaceae bacterium S3730MH12]